MFFFLYNVQRHAKNKKQHLADSNGSKKPFPDPASIESVTTIEVSQNEITRFKNISIDIKLFTNIFE